MIMEENNINMEITKNKPHCPVVDVDGIIAGGKQFDFDITLPDVHIKKYQYIF